MTAPESRERIRIAVAIGMASLAGLLLEVAYTRIISYKLWYYYTYLVIGLALLGIGSGGILVAVLPRLRRVATLDLVARCAVWGAITTLAGYVLIARLPIDTPRLWDYGSRASFSSLARLGLICFALFATFVALGVIIATILGRARAEVGRLYCVDLAGAGLACLLAIPLIARLGPPTVIMYAALVFAALGVFVRPRRRAFADRLHTIIGVAILVALGALVAHDDFVPAVRPEATKDDANDDADYSAWGPVFRVDARFLFGSWILIHDGTFGAAMHPFDGDVGTLERYDTDPRRIPFDVLGRPPRRQLIIGSAGGNEILAALRFGSERIEAVELNPVTVSLLRDHFADETGRLAERPEVDLHQGDGRTYLARSDGAYDLIWYVAPDSYAANNAASSGAFVLSESYLYTSEMIVESLEHLTDDGLMVAQFGELMFDRRPNRTARYLVTARHAFADLGVDEPSAHLLVAVEQSQGSLATIVLKRTPFTPGEIERFTAGVPALKDTRVVYAPGAVDDGSVPARLAGAAGDDDVDAIRATYPREIGAITDDAPFFWHFNGFGRVLGDVTRSLSATDPEDSIGERVLLLLLAFSVGYAALFLLLPLLFVRREWRALRGRASAGIYFACLGLGFMLFEITMIQRLVRFLGYPTYSLTVTLAAILVTAGAGALASRRFAARPGVALRSTLVVVALITLAYRIGLDPLTSALQDQSLGVRVAAAVAVLAPLGFCLGMFMPLGLGLVTGDGSELGVAFGAWAWAVNGFWSVIGSVLTTILAMELGFRAVQLLALGVYTVAVVAFARLQTQVRR